MRTSFRLISALMLSTTLCAQGRLYVYAPDLAARAVFPMVDFGRRFSGIGDLNGDGFADFVYGVDYPVRGLLGAKTGFYIISGNDGRVLRTHLGGKYYHGQCAGLLDVDGDGVRDYALGAPHEVVGSAGRIYIFSGRNGKLILRIDGAKKDEELGEGVMGSAGDIDGDGRPDFHVRSHKAGSIRSWIRSSKTGKVLRTYLGRISNAIGDVDGDKISDYVRGYADSTKGKYAGAVDLYSGKTGKVLRTWYGNGAWEGFGRSVAPAGDVNGDGRPDFVVAAGHYYMNPVGGSGYVKVISSAGPTIWEWRGAGTSSDMFGYQAGGMGDADGDGRPDIYAFSWLQRQRSPLSPARVTVYSGKTGKKLWSVSSDVAGDGFGVWTQALGDVNGDGFSDLALGGGMGGVMTKTFPTLHIVGGNLRSLQVDKASLSLTKTESAPLMLKAGPLHVGKLFLVLGSLARNRNFGLQYDRFRLPLRWDFFTSMTLAYPMGMLYTRGVGFLGSGGKASTRFFLASWLPKELIGMTFTHSYVVFDLKKSRIDFIGEAVQTKVVK